MAGPRLAVAFCPLVLLLAGCFGGGAPPLENNQPTAPWSMPGGSPARTGFTVLNGPLDPASPKPPPTLKWEYLVMPEVNQSWDCSAPVIDESGNLYLASRYEIFSLNSSGLPRWSYPLDEFDVAPNAPTYSLPIMLAGNSLLVCDGHDYIWALTLGGELLWATDRLGHEDMQLALVDDTVVVAADNILRGIDANGVTVWEQDAGRHVEWYTGIAVADNGDFLVRQLGGMFSAYDKLGNELWTYSTGLEFAQDWSYSVYANGLWLIPAPGGMTALTSEGSVAWEFEIPDAVNLGLITRAPGVSANGAIVIPVAVDYLHSEDAVPDSQASVYALDADGTVIWDFKWATLSPEEGFAPVASVVHDGQGFAYLEGRSTVVVLDESGVHKGGFNKSGTPSIFNTWGMAIGPDRQMAIGYIQQWLTVI